MTASRYLDEAFQKVTDKPCAECRHYVKADYHKIVSDQVLFARCQHPKSTVASWFSFATSMRELEGGCGIKGKLWQAKE